MPSRKRSSGGSGARCAPALLLIKAKTGQYGRPSDEGRIQRLRDDKTDFHEYVELLRRTDVWEALRWKFPQDSFANRIDSIRKIRNDFQWTSTRWPKRNE